MSRYFDWAASLKRFVRFDTARSEDLNDALDELTAGLDNLDLDVNRSIKLPTGTADQTLALGAGARANKVLAFDGSGNITVSANDVDTSAASAAAAAASAVTASGHASTALGHANASAASAVASDASADAAALSAAAADASADAAAASAASIAGGPVTSVNGMTGVVTITSLSGLTLNDGYTEEVFTVTGTTPALSAANGSIQTWTLSGASTPTDSLSSGQSIILGITAGANTVTWPGGTVWSKVGGSGAAPTLTSTGANWVILWKIGSTLRAAFLGTA